MALEDDFQRAVLDKTHRQSFLNLIAYRGLPEYVDVLKYQRTIPQVRKDQESAMVTVSYPGSRRSTIFVSAGCFDDHILVLGDFFSVLMDHEYVHAQQFLQGFYTDAEENEKEAYLHQINNLWRRRCSIPFVLRLSMISHLYLPELLWCNVWEKCNLLLQPPQTCGGNIEELVLSAKAQILAFSLDDLIQTIKESVQAYRKST